MPTYSVVTPSLPHRHNWLAESMASVRAQTVRATEHIIGLDYSRIGVARMMNKLMEGVDTDFFIPLADDDLLDGNFAERLLEFSEGADVVYPWCRVVGRGAWNPNAHFDPIRLATSNYIPSTALIRTSSFKEVGMYPHEVCEDHALWVKMLNAGMTFRCVPEQLWTYRFHRKPDGSPENVSDGWDFNVIGEGE